MTPLYVPITVIHSGIIDEPEGELTIYWGEPELAPHRCESCDFLYIIIIGRAKRAPHGWYICDFNINTR